MPTFRVMGVSHSQNHFHKSPAVMPDVGTSSLRGRGNFDRSFSAASEIRAIFCIVSLCALPVEMLAQEQIRRYRILQNDQEIGNLVFTENTSADQIVMRIVSELHTRFVMKISVNAVEEASFTKGIMTSSFVYRTQNGKETLNRSMKSDSNGYLVTKGKDTEYFSSDPIGYNMLSLYSREPLHVKKVYSDLFEKFLDIQRIGTGNYAVSFPNGSRNEYFYENGICSRIEVDHRLYNAVIVIRK